MEQEMNKALLEENTTSLEIVDVDQVVEESSATSDAENAQQIDQISFNVEQEQKKQKVQNIVKNVLVYTFLTICAALAFLPFFWMFVTSVKDEASYRDPTAAFFPDRIMWENYEVVFNQTRSGVNFTQILAKFREM